MKTVIYGAGGHAKVVLDAARLAHQLEIVAVLDDRAELHGTIFEGLEVVGDASILAQLRADGVEALILGVGSVGVTNARRELFERVLAAGLTMPAVRHPAAIISASAIVGAASVILAGAVLNPGARLGANVIVNSLAIVEHDVSIGDHVHVSPGAHIAGGASIGSGSHVGIGATLIQGVRVGRDVLIAAGAVVTRDVADRERVAGVPALSMINR